MIHTNVAITVLLFRGKKAHVVSKRLDDFRERTQPQLGKVHDPIAETLNVDDNHTFGVMVKADDFSESYIIIHVLNTAGLVLIAMIANCKFFLELTINRFTK